MDGYVIVSANSPDNSWNNKEISVKCPGGKRVLSGGAQVWDPMLRDVSVYASYPDDENKWIARAYEVNWVSYDWYLSVYAICVSV